MFDSLRPIGARRAALVATLLTSALSAQVQWQWSERVPVSHPDARSFATFVAAPDIAGNDHFAVLFGGLDARGTTLGDTWEWDGHAWRHNTNSTMVPMLSHAAAALDAGAFVGVMFGGLDTNGAPTDETWMYEFPPSQPFRAWQQASPGTIPPARSDHAMSRTGSGLLMFGGRGVSGALADTWTYDHRGRTWSQLAPAQSPPARSGHRMAYDAVRDRVVLFGGRSANGVLLNDTWEWDGATWTSPRTTNSPAARENHAMGDATAGTLARVVLHGGESGTSILADGWAFDGTDWWPIVPTDLAARTGHGFAALHGGAQPTTFGGIDATGATDSTWTLEGFIPLSPPTSPLVSWVAPGCGPTATLPSITSDDAPQQDAFQPTPLTYELSDLPAAALPGSGLGVFVFGFLGGAVPCNPAFPPLQTDLQFILPFAYSGTGAQVGYTIPSTPPLSGAVLYHQAVAILPNAALAWVTSDLVRVRIGQ